MSSEVRQPSWIDKEDKTSTKPLNFPLIMNGETRLDNAVSKIALYSAAWLRVSVVCSRPSFPSSAHMHVTPCDKCISRLCDHMIVWAIQSRDYSYIAMTMTMVDCSGKYNMLNLYPLSLLTEDIKLWNVSLRSGNCQGTLFTCCCWTWYFHQEICLWLQMPTTMGINSVMLLNPCYCLKCIYGLFVSDFTTKI